MQKLLVATLLTAAATAPALAAPGYKFTVLGDWSRIHDINNLGVGAGQGGECCDYVAQTYSAAGIAAVPLPSSIVSSGAWGINDHGTIVGTAGTSTWEERAFVYANGTYRDLGGLAGDSSTARAVNNAGSVLVTYGKPNDLAFGSYVWSEAGGMVDLGSLGGNYTWGSALNERGQVAGISSTEEGYGRVFRWTDGEMEDLGTFQSEFGYSVDGISEQGEVFGSRDEMHSSHAYIIRADGMVEDHSDLSRISYIDAGGRIYGTDQAGWGVIVEDGVKTSIAALTEGAAGWSFGTTAVNEAGQILATAHDGTDYRVVLLSPVPEPATYGMLLAGAAVLGWAGRRRR
ncbi:PEP-CTERM sorting domain-containing protein [Pseudoduganella sp. SL102]|uniref:PEP-CTERM sorting domain-containing protein n=1 Tax=Pseudoduganella sp. SL102 TaxID=2995154 RepID=UPI00248AD297|nr:PEP-CTERM sorting domain-containing protein [Pseudoduganella sp. SL102]WBS00651.1 PEP-CTERM sorting domain-containing protein [Pseudoduganella sp. SL102]